MTVEGRFRSLYAAAAQRGLDIDAKPPHVVRWMLAAPPEPDGPETRDEFLDTVALRIAEAEGGPEVEVEPWSGALVG